MKNTIPFDPIDNIPTAVLPILLLLDVPYHPLIPMNVADCKKDIKPRLRINKLDSSSKVDPPPQRLLTIE